MPRDKGTKQVSANKKAFHDYFVLERFEAGIELFGTEVKSIRAGQVNLKDSYCTVKDGQLYARGLHISPYEKGSFSNRDPMRPKRLLMHKMEIAKLGEKVAQDAEAGATWQFLRMGYFCKDPDSTQELSVFNRTVPLKDSWAKTQK